MTEESQTSLESAERQVDDLIESLEEQEAHVWAYLFTSTIALIAGLLAAYLYTQKVRQKRKTHLQRLKETLRGGIRL